MANVHVMPFRNGWRVRKTGADRALRAGLTEAEARALAAKTAASGATIYIHRPDGRIAERLTA